MKQKRKLRAYIGGPMTGIPQHNFPAFDAARADLERRGYAVVSPADIDRDFEITEERTAALTGRFLKAVLIEELNEIFNCDVIFALPGWERSKGFAVEAAFARCFGIPIIAYHAKDKSAA